MKRTKEAVNQPDRMMFPVPTDIVLKLIGLCSTKPDPVCNNCDKIICSTFECFKCKKHFNVHDKSPHLCLGQRKCRDCKNMFCSDCAEAKFCAKPTLGSWSPYDLGKCNGVVTRCAECLAKKVCEKCGHDISRCWYCEEDPDSLAGAYITKHVCKEGHSGWYSAKGGYVPHNEIDELPYVN